MCNKLPMALLDRVITARGWTQNEAERRLRLPTGIIAAWRSGVKKPGAVFQTIMFRALGIEPEAWLDETQAKRLADAIKNASTEVP